jgi:hypothetical protein
LSLFFSLFAFCAIFVFIDFTVRFYGKFYTADLTGEDTGLIGHIDLRICM